MEDEANAIVETVQNIFDTVTREFNAALEERQRDLAKDEERRQHKAGGGAASSSSSLSAPAVRRGDWVGLDADGRARLAIESRKQVDALKDIFDRVQGTIDGADMVEQTPEEVQRATVAVREEIERRKRINAKLEGLIKEAAALEKAAQEVDKA